MRQLLKYFPIVLKNCLLGETSEHVLELLRFQEILNIIKTFQEFSAKFRELPNTLTLTKIWAILKWKETGNRSSEKPQMNLETEHDIEKTKSLKSVSTIVNPLLLFLPFVVGDFFRFIKNPHKCNWTEGWAKRLCRRHSRPTPTWKTLHRIFTKQLYLL